MHRTLALAFTLALATVSLHAATHNVLRKAFNVGEGGTLHLDAGAGDITVVTGGSGVAIEVVRDAKNESYIEKHHVTFAQNGNDVTVKTEYESAFHFFNFGDDLRVKFNVRVPAHYNVDVNTSGGDIDLTGVDGKTDAHTSGGDIKAARITGDLSLHTSGGDITIDTVNGPAKVHTSGGSIDVHNIGGDLVAHTSGGSIKIDEARGAIDASTSGGSVTATFSAAPHAASKLSTSGGNIHVSLPAGAAVDLDAHSSGGDVETELPVTIVGHHDENTLVGKINGGGPKLLLRTSGGDIEVRKQ
jgi:hypothetical protein